MSIKARYMRIRRITYKIIEIISKSMKTNEMIIELSTMINAPVEVCFDLSRSIDLHMESTRHTGEKAIAGRTSGLIELGETVTWRAKHFGVWQNLTSKITEFKSPDYFTDEMVNGAFKSFRHEHLFFAINDQTVMKDIFMFESPLGWLGRMANILFLGKYMERLLQKRNKVIKLAAETSQTF
ncbi:SRPBCC family protein [Mucilaginibacter sp. L3T2-6]|uniref:SRPBCC family protein n=1 Tax=Mucilaginibacter sp. L3T2-6 TaxID=3062491 RepID=UPI002949700E|nr:SRPBCC family protein [Mucilaginibacter sp. L3T2-6]MDV6217067.1 SRPBCC family protein [Mucilaginibacter sp. L3T2-6]